MSWSGSSRSARGVPEGIETRADLAHELTALRARSGLTIRALATRLDIPSATLGGYFSGRHLPGTAQFDLFCALLRECAVPDEQLGAWVEALARVRVSSDARVGRMPSPYRGLDPFQTADAALFFGREATIEDLLARLRQLSAESQARSNAAGLLLVLGPSGSGKTSLLLAGLVAKVQAGVLGDDGEGWSTAVITPGESPAETLFGCLAALDGPRRLIVVDQLEEVFGVAAAERSRFFEALAGRARPALSSSRACGRISSRPPSASPRCSPCCVANR